MPTGMHSRPPPADRQAVGPVVRAHAATSGSCVMTITVWPRPARSASIRKHLVPAVLGVERAGRLVRQDDPATVHEGASDRHALLLAPGQCPRAVAETLRPGQTPSSSASARSTRRIRPRPGVGRRQLDVLPGGGGTEQVVGLEHEPERNPAVARQVRPGPGARRSCRGTGRRLPSAGPRQPRMFISVDLPDPDGPITANELTRARCAATRPDRARVDDGRVDRATVVRR